jgi:hypothetical protein
MTIGGDDLELRSEVFLDGLGLGGGFDDDEIHTHGPAADRRAAKQKPSPGVASRWGPAARVDKGVAA